MPQPAATDGNNAKRTAVDREKVVAGVPLSAGNASALSVEGVTKRFHTVEVLRDVSLSIGRREIRAICGENGAGKSTLVKIIAGVHRVDEGIVFLEGGPREFAIRSRRRNSALPCRAGIEPRDQPIGARQYLARQPQGASVSSPPHSA